MPEASEPQRHSDALERAAATMREVRRQCVWSQQITHHDLLPYLIEEAYELIDAVESGNRAEMREELGDLLWQVLFHAAVAADEAEYPFDIDDVARTVTEKMVRRHPHVFGEAVARTPAEVLVYWNAAKAAEKRERRSVLDGIPRAMPALARAQKIAGRAENVGVHAIKTAAQTNVESEDELGERLFALVSQARARGWDAEGALRAHLATVEDEIRAAESNRGIEAAAGDAQA